MGRGAGLQAHLQEMLRLKYEAQKLRQQAERDELLREVPPSQTGSLRPCA